jgi:hypothetical protein
VVAVDSSDWSRPIDLAGQSGGVISTADAADWTKPVAILSSGAITDDYPDWTLASLVVAGSITPVGPPVSGQSAWWDASQITGAADGSLLASWPDASGNGVNLTQATAGSQPTYYSTTPAKLVNGLPAVWFSGAQIMAAAGLVESAPWSVFYVANNQDNTLGHSVAIWAVSPAHFSFSLIITGINGHLELNAGTGLLQAYATGIGLHAVSQGVDGGSSFLNTDGTVTTGNAGSNAIGAGDSFYVGWVPPVTGTVGWDGPICEMAVYPRLLSTVEQATLRGYAQGKWGTP